MDCMFHPRMVFGLSVVAFVFFYKISLSEGTMDCPLVYCAQDLVNYLGLTSRLYTFPRLIGLDCIGCFI